MIKTIQIVGNSKFGGATYLILKWCKYLLSQGCRVDVLSSDKKTIIELNKIKGIRVVDNIYIPREISITTDIKAFFELVSLLRHEKYDVVHTYTATPGFLGRICARITGVSAIFHHQAGWTVTDFSPLFERLLYTPLEYLATLASTKGICVSYAVSHQANQLHIAPKNRLVTICNGIDPEPFIIATENNDGKAFRRELNIPSDKLLIGTTGRLAPQKDNESLILAIKYLSENNPELPIKLLLAGDGSDRIRLKNIVNNYGLKEYVCFLGFYSDIPKLLAAIDIFVSPSLREGLSISIMEAMAAAKPIITTSILPNLELIEDEVNGLIVPPKSPANIAHEILRLINDKYLAKRCAVNARRKILNYYTIERTFKETWDLYSKSIRI